MTLFIFCTGIVSVLAGAGLQVPTVSALFMPTEQPGMLLHLFGLMAFFLGVMLILCSRDLKHRAPLVMWEGVLRLGWFVVMAGYGVWRGGGVPMVASAVSDLIVGAAYLAWLPIHAGRSASDLLFDRQAVGVTAR